MPAAEVGGLFLFFFDLNGFQVVSLEDFEAIEAFHVIDAIAASNHLCPGVIANGRHNTRYR